MDSDADLDEAIERYQKALEAHHAGDQSQSSTLSGLGCALVSRYQRSGIDDADLQLAITYHRKALESRPEGHPDRDISLNNLGAALWLRFKLTRDQIDLEEAILHHREALTLRPEGDENRSSSLCNLAAGLLVRYEETGQLDDLNTAIKLYEQAYTEDDATSLDNLAVSLRTRFRREGNVDDIERALGLQLKALPLRPFNHRNRGDSLSNMGLTLHDGFELTHEIDALNSAISYHLEALKYRTVGNWDRPSTLNDVGHALHARYQAQCNLSDLEEAISHHREALQLTSSAPRDSLDRFTCANALACSFWLHYHRFGVADSLEKSIINHRVALGRASSTKDRVTSLSNYGVSLLARFKRDGNLVELNEAITSQRNALRLCPTEGSMRSAPSRQLALALEKRFLDSGNVGDLEEATLLHRSSVIHEPPESSSRHIALSNLGNNLLLLYEQNGDLQALKEAIKIHTDVLSKLNPTHADYATALGCRGASLRSRYEEFGDLQDLAEAVELRTQALQFESSDLSRAIIHNDIGNIYWLRYERLGNPFDIHASISHFRDAVALSRTSPHYMDFLLINPTIESQRDFLIHLPKSLACDACACAIESGEIEKAVELLELGRVILWNRMRGYRHTMDGLRKSHPTLVKYSSPFELKMRNQRLLLQQWDEVVTKIRMLPGHDGFLKPIPFDTLQSAGAEGPVIIVNLSERRCDAIILVQGRPPVLVPLQSISVDAVEAMNLWNMRLNKIQTVLRNLWKHVGYPIHQQLLEINVQEMSRIWWYPTGQLCALPIHAAGPYHVEMKNIPDLYISSYTPTLSSLISARAVKDLATSPSFLAIGVPDNTLRSAEEEIAKIKNYIPDVKVMIGEQVTRDPLLCALRQHSWAHFACHGHWNARQPFQSCFELFGKESISVLELAKERLTHAEFAFLSACFAATPDLAGAPDEVIHLASALQFSGFRSVVGTLWELIDKDAPQLASDFYQDLVQEGKDKLDFKDTARALSLAVNKLREKPNMTPNRWIQIIHIGG
ncbi:uncharacterized protein LACBIDRAFT_233630 [Laccaria bicolor S238N-H82]|uniref:Predicted protein n=1 Tax=Laccaria bicolor (strain S238N-H82 / ATCC MYA-4686) TaxID=486041 RepID=B0D5H3_LACBS|nr:uncharacterized protein LACBIDRAFT_233630 [Laccaria bicolor S238N-H82]EDR09769.1 predicted protein [Laccaria bicolor S238N-H82]|eukprot:XP_001879154.1 predicted protein [Laccaria bicolor S238N-H82]